MPCGHLCVCRAEMLGKLLTKLLCGLGKAVVIIPAPCLIDTVDAPGGAVFLYPAVLPRAHTLLKEADDRAVFGHIPCPCCRDTLRLGKAIAVAYDRLQCLYSFVHDAVALCVHFVKQLLVLPVFRNNIRAAHYHNAVVYPLSVISAELRQSVHAEPEQAIVGELKRLLPLELGIQAVATRDLFEGLELVHGKKTHIRGTGKPCAVDCAGAEPGFNLF